jgi:hypothetical protein
MRTTNVHISAVQCWTSREENLGAVPCTVMSDSLLSSACEVDLCGVLAMHALQLASETPSALLDWNNNHGNDPSKAVCFHCGNLPKHFFNEVRIIPGTVGKENNFGTCVGRVKASPMSFVRFSTGRCAWKNPRLLRRRSFTDDPLERSAARASWKSQDCRNCCATFVTTVSSITSPPTSRVSRPSSTKPLPATSIARCTLTTDGNAAICPVIMPGQ